MGTGYLPVDTPPGTAPLPPGQAVPANVRAGATAQPQARKTRARSATPPARTRKLTQRRRTS